MLLSELILTSVANKRLKVKPRSYDLLSPPGESRSSLIFPKQTPSLPTIPAPLTPHRSVRGAEGGDELRVFPPDAFSPFLAPQALGVHSYEGYSHPTPPMAAGGEGAGRPRGRRSAGAGGGRGGAGGGRHASDPRAAGHSPYGPPPELPPHPPATGNAQSPLETRRAVRPHNRCRSH